VSADARFRWTTIAHAGRALLGPLSANSVETLLAGVTLRAAGARPEVLDVGCAMRRLGARGTGVDPNEAFLEEARERARGLGLAGDLTLHACEWADAPTREGPADLAICTGATHAFGDLDAALAGLRTCVSEGGWALVGTGYWRHRISRCIAAESPVQLPQRRLGLSVLKRNDHTDCKAAPKWPNCRGNGPGRRDVTA